jgi:hypothetical protein
VPYFACARRYSYFSRSYSNGQLSPWPRSYPETARTKPIKKGGWVSKVPQHSAERT